MELSSMSDEPGEAEVTVRREARSMIDVTPGAPLVDRRSA